MSNGDTKNPNPFHQGESYIQARAGASKELVAMANQAITDFMPNQHQTFFKMLPMIFIGAKDKHQDVWASILIGKPGFIQINDEHSFTINSQFMDIDPLVVDLKVGDEMGFLGIQFETRRRNRVSALITEVTTSHITLKIKQCYGNCPKYIQRRQGKMTKPEVAPESIAFDSFDKSMTRFIHSVDSLFIASQYIDGDEDLNRGVDSSHRGGMPGFVNIPNNKTLLIPDYMGNFFFNTIGNISLNSKVGIHFLDYENGHRVMLTGTAEVIWAEDNDIPFDGVDRMIRFTLKHGYHLKNSFPFEWKFKGYSPFSRAYSGEDILF
ncbi:MAG: pyridoxamine 5'-phosphate oxidase family protein [Cocleimonas sp.]